MATKLNKKVAQSKVTATKANVAKKVAQKPQQNKPKVKLATLSNGLKPLKKTEAVKLPKPKVDVKQKATTKKVAEKNLYSKTTAKKIAPKNKVAEPLTKGKPATENKGKNKIEDKGKNNNKSVALQKTGLKVAAKVESKKSTSNQNAKANFKLSKNIGKEPAKVDKNSKAKQNKFSPHMITDEKKNKGVIMHESMPKKKDTKQIILNTQQPIKQVKKNNMSDAALLKAAKEALKKVPQDMFSVSTGTNSNEHFSKTELDKFRKHVLDLKEDSIEELEMQETQLKLMEDVDKTEESSFSVNMNEQTNEAMEREKAFMQTQRTADYIKKLDDALVRIDNGTFGICRMCGLRLDSKRMMAVPVTQVCTIFKNTNKHCHPGKIFFETLHPVKAEDYVPVEKTDEEDE